MKTVLNIAAGKILPIFDQELYGNKLFIVNLDPMYFSGLDGQDTEELYELWDSDKTEMVYCIEEAEPFMERTKMMFDHICLYRFLEHISFTRVQYFIYLLSTITKKGSIVDVIVPNYELLAEMIIKDNPEDPDFEADNILLTTELLNEPSCPHASIWTVPRIYHFFQLEGHFEITYLKDQYEFDGRDIYVRFIAKRK